MRRTLLILVSVLVAGISSAAPPSPAPATVEIVSAEFGTFDASNPQEIIFEPTLVVPHRQGQRYGWVIEVRTTQRALSVAEEYLLPNSVTTARKAPDSSAATSDIPQQRRNQVSQRQLVPVGGKIYGEWAVGANEPAGHRHLQVLVEGQVAASFEYDVE